MKSFDSKFKVYNNYDYWDFFANIFYNVHTKPHGFPSVRELLSFSLINKYTDN